MNEETGTIVDLDQVQKLVDSSTERLEFNYTNRNITIRKIDNKVLAYIRNIEDTGIDHYVVGTKETIITQIVDKLLEQI